MKLFIWNLRDYNNINELFRFTNNQKPSYKTSIRSFFFWIKQTQKEKRVGCLLYIDFFVKEKKLNWICFWVLKLMSWSILGIILHDWICRNWKTVVSRSIEIKKYNHNEKPPNSFSFTISIIFKFSFFNILRERIYCTIIALFHS